MPLLAITTDIAVASRGRFTLTELDQDALFRPITKWNTVIDRAADVPEAFRTAFEQMTSGRPGAVHLGFPYDVQAEPLDHADIHGNAAHGATPHERAAPDAEAVTAAAEAIAGAERPLFICGGGVVISGAEDALAALAEHIAAPVAVSISGQGSIADDHPLALGVVGSNGGTPETERLVDSADLVIFVGCRAGSVTTNRWRHPDPDEVRVVHIDIDDRAIGVNYRADAAVVGDARACIEALHEAVADITASSDAVAAAIAEAKAEKFAAFRALAQSTEAPIRPERLVADLQAVLPDDAIIAVDPGTPCPYFSAYFECNGGGRRIVANRAHGALGYSLPAALGAAFARPEAKSVAVMGDGAFGFVAGELETVARLGLPVTLVVVSNSTFGWIKAGQQAKFQGRYFSVDFGVTDHAAVAAAYGVKSWRVSDPGDLRKTLAAAVEHGGPTLVDVVSQPLHEAQAPVSEWIA